MYFSMESAVLSKEKKYFNIKRLFYILLIKSSSYVFEAILTLT